MLLNTPVPLVALPSQMTLAWARLQEAATARPASRCCLSLLRFIRFLFLVGVSPRCTAAGTATRRRPASHTLRRWSGGEILMGVTDDKANKTGSGNYPALGGWEAVG